MFYQHRGHVAFICSLSTGCSNEFSWEHLGRFTRLFRIINLETLKTSQSGCNNYECATTSCQNTGVQNLSTVKLDDWLHPENKSYWGRGGRGHNDVSGSHKKSCQIGTFWPNQLTYLFLGPLKMIERKDSIFCLIFIGSYSQVLFSSYHRKSTTERKRSNITLFEMI